MNVLVIGSGGREHALCWKLAQSDQLDTLYCAPGNGGIADVASCVSLNVDDHDAVIAFCREQDIRLVVVGPEQPLVDGIADSLRAAQIRVFGPSQAAAELEGSKGFMKDLCAKYGIPTAAYARFTDAETAKDYVRQQGAPIVVKTDGLAAGKGVTVAMTEQEAIDAIDANFAGRFGDAGLELVIEEFMQGEEASFFALTDGKTALAMVTAQDHKAVGDGDTGPNTGGMGAYSPAPVMTDALCQQVMTDIIQPTIDAFNAEGIPYQGVLYAGLMITETGPRLIEYNIRFGDPECQVLMTRMKSDLLPVLVALADGDLGDNTLEWHDQVALVVVMAAQGYPGSYEKNTVIEGIADANAVAGVTVLHAGTKAEDGRILATGGRVLGVTATGATVSEAQARAYQGVDRITWPEGFCRRDIGWRAVEREKNSG